MQGETMLRVANVGSKAAMESIRDALDRLGLDYEHIRSEPNEVYYPRTAISTCPTTPRTRWTTSCKSSPKSSASTPRSSETRCSLPVRSQHYVYT